VSCTIPFVLEVEEEDEELAVLLLVTKFEEDAEADVEATLEEVGALDDTEDVLAIDAEDVVVTIELDDVWDKSNV
jgi:hypothetical protein